MFERPRRLPSDGAIIHVLRAQSQELLSDLMSAGFQCRFGDGEFGATDGGTNVRQEVAFIELIPPVDGPSVDRFLRHWKSST